MKCPFGAKGLFSRAVVVRFREGNLLKSNSLVCILGLIFQGDTGMGILGACSRKKLVDLLVSGRVMTPSFHIFSTLIETLQLPGHGWRMICIPWQLGTDADETNSQFAPENRPKTPKKEGDGIPTIHFQAQNCC